MLLGNENFDRKKRFVDICRTHIHRAGINKLLEHIEKNGFYEAPASTKYHGAYEGGLCDHSLNVFDAINSVSVRTFGRADPRTSYLCKKSNWESLVLVSLFHDICKMDNYKIKPNIAGEFGEYVWNPDSVPLGHGEKSVMILQDFIKLTEEEKLAIRWHMGAFDKAFIGGEKALNDAFRKSNLAVLLHLADMEATYLYE